MKQGKENNNIYRPLWFSKWSFLASFGRCKVRNMVRYFRCASSCTDYTLDWSFTLEVFMVFSVFCQCSGTRTFRALHCTIFHCPDGAFSPTAKHKLPPVKTKFHFKLCTVIQTLMCLCECVCWGGGGAFGCVCFAVCAYVNERKKERVKESKGRKIG